MGVVSNEINRLKSDLKNTKNSLLFWNGLFVVLTYIPIFWDWDTFINIHIFLNFMIIMFGMLSAFLGDVGMDDDKPTKLLFIYVSWFFIFIGIVGIISWGIAKLIIQPIYNSVIKFNDYLDGKK